MVCLPRTSPPYPLAYSEVVFPLLSSDGPVLGPEKNDKGAWSACVQNRYGFIRVSDPWSCHADSTKGELGEDSTDRRGREQGDREEARPWLEFSSCTKCSETQTCLQTTQSAGVAGLQQGPGGHWPVQAGGQLSGAPGQGHKARAARG